MTYEIRRAQIALLRKGGGVRPGDQVYVRALIDGRLATWPATVGRHLASGRYLVFVQSGGKTVRITTDATNVARSPRIIEERIYGS
jgi:hypothetical protein